MLPAAANAPVCDRPAPPPAVLLELFAGHAAEGRCVAGSVDGARSFLERWPDPQAWVDEPLADRIAGPPGTQALLLFVMLRGWLRPGWDWLVHRKLTGLWGELAGTPLAGDIDRFCSAAGAVGFTSLQARRAASQSVVRLLIQTGRPLHALTLADVDDLADACRRREAATGRGWRHFQSALVCAHTVLFHLDVVAEPPPPAQEPDPLAARFTGCQPAVAALLVTYLDRKTGSCRTKTVSCLATRLAHFGRYLHDLDPDLSSFTDLDRRRHIEPFLNAVAAATSTKNGEPITVADQDRRIRAVEHMLSEITEWGWDDAPPRKLIFRTDMPRLRRPLPRYLPVDTDRRLHQALVDSP